MKLPWHKEDSDTKHGVVKTSTVDRVEEAAEDVLEAAALLRKIAAQRRAVGTTPQENE